MAEAIAAVGFVAAIIQISSFAKKLVDRCKEFHSRSKDVPKGFSAISIQLPLIISSLDQIRGQAQSGSLSEDSLVSLQPVIDACHGDVKHLEGILNKVLPAPNASSWDRNTLALKSLRYEAEVNKSIASLGSHLQNLIFFQTSITASRVLLQLGSNNNPREVSLSEIQNQ
ncbi:MAG: hypothetical protein Q9197_001141 [Variospora fuerteventurae]